LTLTLTGFVAGVWGPTFEAHAGSTPVLDVTASPYLAVGDGVTNDRAAIQNAIDDASALGSGTVLLPSGHQFLSGSLPLKDNVTLNIVGTLLHSQKDTYYTYVPIRGRYAPGNVRGDLTMFHNLPLVYAGQADDVHVTGSGTIQITRVTD